MTTTTLEPRVSVLEEGQKALQRDLLILSSVVKEQGLQQTTAIAKLAESQVNHNTQILSAQSADKIEILAKIANIGKIDWTLILGFITVLVLLLGAISTPIWMSFNNVDRDMNRAETHIELLTSENKLSIRERVEVMTKVKVLEDQLNRIENSIKDSSNAKP